MDAAAVQANWERLRDPAMRSPSITYASDLDTMTAEGQVLQFTLTRSIVAYENGIAEAMNWIAQPQALAAGPQAFDAEPIGAGPLVLDSWTRNGEMVLKRNDAYWDAPRPHLDELVLTANPDGPQRLSAVLAGGADAMFAGEADLLSRAAESVQAQLNQYDNVRVEIEVLDFAAAAAAAEVAQRTFQMTGVAINFVEPALSLFTTLHSSARGNSTGVSDPALDAALDAALGTTDADERAEAYDEVGRLFTELSPALTYVRSGWAVIHTDRVHGVQMYGLGAIRTDGIWLSDCPALVHRAPEPTGPGARPLRGGPGRAHR